MTINPKEVRTLYEVLVESIETGLNATLTPKDCWILLSLLSDKHQTSYGTVQRKNSSIRVHNVDEILNNMYIHLSEAAKTVIEEISSEILPNRRKRRK